MNQPNEIDMKPLLHLLVEKLGGMSCDLYGHVPPDKRHIDGPHPGYSTGSKYSNIRLQKIVDVVADPIRQNFVDELCLLITDEDLGLVMTTATREKVKAGVLAALQLYNRKHAK